MNQAKKYIPHAVAIILAFFLFLSIRTCNQIYDESSALKGEYDALKAQAAKDKAEGGKAIQILETAIEQRDSIIAGLNLDIQKTEAGLAQAAGRIEELEAVEATLTDKDEIITNLRAQIAEWRERFTLAQSVIRDKDAIIFSMSEKYESQRKVSLEYKAQRDAAWVVIEKADIRFSVLEKRLRKQRGQSLVWKIFGGVGWGVLGYKSLKGK